MHEQATKEPQVCIGPGASSCADRDYGLGVLVVAGLFAYQLNRLTDDFGSSVSDALDTGFYFAAIGGLIGFVSGFLPSGWAARRTVEQDTAVIDERAYDR